ncbi:MAG: acyltransferase [Saprospiraceae bacterium]|nr:MAG: acyltransferase [Saprospiraceae bacterium]
MTNSIAAERAQLMDLISQLPETDFEALTLAVFRYQARYNPLYREYLKLLRVSPTQVLSIPQIPFLPIAFFKNHSIKSGNWSTETEFSSSGTTGASTSVHHVRNTDWYRKIARKAFQTTYGNLNRYCVLALLPAYLERQGSSLVFMVDDFIRHSAYHQSGFFLDDLEEMLAIIGRCRSEAIPVLLIGVSFALWELAEKYPQDLSGVTIMETGGMKGRRREITRTELHEILKKAFAVPHIHSEYGMTELFSQAYAPRDGKFIPAPTMKVLTREITDPLSISQPGKTGVINMIDMANLDTISFIATDDLGKVYPDGTFEVLGRLDASDIRGCNLMVD